MKDTLLGDYEDFHSTSVYVMYTVFQTVESIQRPKQVFALSQDAYNFINIVIM